MRKIASLRIRRLKAFFEAAKQSDRTNDSEFIKKKELQIKKFKKEFGL